MSAASFDTFGTTRDPGSADFPGCESFHLPANEIDRYEGRLEFWDGDTETAWKVCEPTSIQHEAPCQELAQMAGRFAMLRGSRIACFGSADLVRLDATGRKRWLMQADQVLYLHPDRVRLQGPAIDVDADPLRTGTHGTRSRGSQCEGHRRRLGLHAISDASRRALDRTAEGSGAGVHERSRLSAAYPRRGGLSAAIAWGDIRNAHERNAESIGQEVT